MTEASKTRSLFFVNRWVDYALAGGFSALFACIIYLAPGIGGISPTYIYGLSGFLVWVGNWPHFAATSVRLYRSRTNMAQYPFTAFAVPVIVGIGTWLSFSYPTTVAPYFIKTFLLWSPYHYSGQTVGVTLIYSKRSGFSFSKLERKILSIFVFSTFIYTSALAETYGASRDYWGVAYPSLGISPIVPEFFRTILLVSGFALSFIFLRKLSAPNVTKSPIVLVPVVAQSIWFLWGPGLTYYSEFIPLFHSIQYLLVAYTMECAEYTEDLGPSGTKPRVRNHMALWAGMNIALGAILFYLLPHLFNELGYELPLSLAIINAAVQIHHFFVDGVIWKLRRSGVGRPLMSNAVDLYRGLKA